MKIAVTKNQISDLILRDFHTQNLEFQFKELTQDEIAKQFKNGLIDIALIDPLTYAKVVKNIDIRIIPGNVLFLEDYTKKIGINIASRESKNNKLSLPLESEYLYQISKLLLTERYHLSLMDVPATGGSEITFDTETTMLDLSEDWYESFRFALPLLFWVVKYEEGKTPVEDLVNIVNSFSLSLNEEIYSDDNTRQGRILRNWNSECENALDETLELLFYHNITSEIFSAKVYENEE